MINLLKKCAFIYCSCDSYSDLWEPYFCLLNKYWPDIKMNIILNTEHKVFNNPEYFTIKVNTFKCPKKCSWSKRLLNILNSINEEFIFLVIDDLFLQSKVDNSHFSNLLQFLNETDNLASIQLQGIRNQTWEDKTGKDIKENHSINGKSYAFRNIELTKTETFPTLWKKSVLIKWLRPWESIWGFEGYGIKRSKHGRLKEKVLRLQTPNIYNFLWVDECSPVINGKWFDSIKIDEFFNSNGITIDFNKRGRISYEEYLTHYVSLFEHFKKYPLHEGIRRGINYIRSVYLS